MKRTVRFLQEVLEDLIETQCWKGAVPLSTWTRHPAGGDQGGIGAGGGALPLEAQRLGLEAYASDLNRVAVLINKVMIEIPPKFAGMPPVNPEARSKKQLIAREWTGAAGLAEDVRCYGQWMGDQAEKRIGHLDLREQVDAAWVRLREIWEELQPVRPGVPQCRRQRQLGLIVTGDRLRRLRELGLPLRSRGNSLQIPDDWIRPRAGPNGRLATAEGLKICAGCIVFGPAVPSAPVLLQQGFR